MKSRFTYSLVLLLVLAATVAGLARRSPREQRPIRREIRAYFAANVLPVLRQQRQKLEPQLTAADRAQLATYRTQLKALKEQGRALRQAAAPAAGSTPGTRPVLTEAQREQARQLRFQARGIMLNVAQMAQRYDEPIGQLAQEVQPQKEKWATDIKSIVAKNATPEQQEQLAAAKSRRHGQGPGQLRRFFKPAMFLLMDPNAPAEAPGERGVSTSSFYPNPAAATTQLEYEVKKAGPVSIDLLDKDGNKLRTLLPKTQQEKGSQRQQLDLSGLPTGTYFYKITTKSGTQTRRFVKE
ncbi:T9SS type A sorting domain-containing protein [Hymenobacter sp. DH14]|uniref:T9SS type A sorting domain-containing protein n=1 Tax=Hymenobacter cyanobacteriorum TaxID=2926463 RepID=A0A9X1VGG5_9BACT|nr:T9SS type A sorting domain-containing protein [Hymenobacter cyanobacteriorum]MCI1186425.1 T9SS type A sorting domain-containing protein [Hymenobacter cyanobacteriorum]